MQVPTDHHYITEFNELANAMPQLIWVGVPDGSIIYINDRIRDYRGAYQRDDGTWDWHGVIHADDLPLTLQRWEAARATGSAFEMEHRLQANNGEYRWHLNRAKPHIDAGGAVTRWYGSTTDVHLQKEAERALRASEAEFRASFENASVGMIQIDATQGRILRVNAACCAMTQYTEEELYHLTIGHLLHPDNRAADEAMLMSMVKGAQWDHQTEKKFVRKDGMMIWCMTSANLIFDEQRLQGKISLVIRDITRKKKAEDALLDSEAKFKAFLHDSPLLAWSKNAEGRYVYLNTSFEKRFNVKLTDWKDKTDEDIHQHSFAKVFRENDLQVLATGEPLMGIEQMLEKDGTISEWSSFKFCYTDSEGTRYVGGIGYDITKQRLAEKASAAAREQLELTFKNVPTGILLFDQSRKLVFVNDKGAEITGYGSAKEMMHVLTLEQLREKSLQRYDLYDEEGKVLPAGNSPIQQSFQKRESNFGVYRIVHHIDQRQQWIYYVCTPILNAQGDVDMVIGTITDITLQKEAENLLIQEQRDSAERLEKLVELRTRELKDSNEGLQQFAHVASHDLKEPVRKVKIFGGRMKEEFGDQIPEKARLYLSKIESAADRMYAMIDGVLQYSTIQAVPEGREEMDLAGVVDAIETDLEIVFQQKKATLIYGNLPTIYGVPVMIYQLFYNLINNAMKFARTDEPPVIEMFADKIQVDGKSYHRISVKDNGIGFEAEESEKIFQTFARLHPKDLYDGTGLGLSLCRKIVERHGGSITASSEQGSGSEFTVVLPA